MRQIKFYSALSMIALTLLSSCRTDVDSDQFSNATIQNQGSFLKSSIKNTSATETTTSSILLSTQDSIKINVSSSLLSEEIDSDNNPQNMPPVK